MIHRVPVYDPEAPILLVDIGNTKIGVATWQGGQIKTPLDTPTADQDLFRKTFDAHFNAVEDGTLGATVVASVVPQVLGPVCQHIGARQEKDALVVGDTIAFPIDLGVSDKKGIGVDRVCAAAAAFDTLKTGCIVVDFGTAVTVDLISDEGELCGGAILPGLRMQLRALHEFTAQLPKVEPERTDAVFGRDTVEAIRVGVSRGLAGSVRNLVEGYATSLNRWPQVVGTGGDAEFMLPFCDFLDTAVDHLTFRGMALAYAKHMLQRSE